MMFDAEISAVESQYFSITGSKDGLPSFYSVPQTVAVSSHVAKKQLLKHGGELSTQE